MSKASALNDHAHRLAEEAGVTLDTSRVARGGRVRHYPAKLNRRAVARIRPIKSEVTYLVALHEIGHIADRNGQRGRRLDKELAAWRWALDHTIMDPSPYAWRMIARSCGSYLGWASRKFGGGYARSHPLYEFTVSAWMAAGGPVWDPT